METLIIVIPIVLIFVIGYIAQKFLSLNLRTLSTFSMYILIPTLVFHTFYTEGLTFDVIYYALFILTLCVVLIIISSSITNLFKDNEEKRCGFILSSVFMNNGNYGTPLILVVFGDKALGIAIMLMVLQQLLMSSVGIYYAVKGKSSGRDGRITSLQKIVKLPIIYAAILGIVFNMTDVRIPNAIENSVVSIADAAIPVIMLILGMQLANITFKKVQFSRVTAAVGVKLIIAPIVAWLITLVMPTSLLANQIMILAAAMPTAANTTLYAVEFQTDQENVSAATFLSTIISLVTIPILLWFIL